MQRGSVPGGNVVNSPRTIANEEEAFLQSEEEKEEMEERVVDGFGFLRASKTGGWQPVVDAETRREREKKWLAMLDNWPHFMNHKFDKVKARCRKGIPSSLRGRAWSYLSGAAFHMECGQNRHVFEVTSRGGRGLSLQEVNKMAGEIKWVEDIKKDLNRQFPEHEMFARWAPHGKLGQMDLFRLLKAYTVLHPEEGYCQGQAPLASVLVMHMPLKPAFYTFVQVCHKYLPGYFSPGLEAIQIDGEILFQLLRVKSRISYRHLKKNKVDPVLYMVEWFMCVFCRTLPWPSVLRVWDMFFCEGVKVLFKVAIVLFRYALGTAEQCKQFPDLQGIVMRLKNIPEEILREDFLLEKVIELDLDDSDLETIHYRVLKARRLRNESD